MGEATSNKTYLPSLSLIFDNEGDIDDATGKLLDAADAGITAIEAAVPGLTILKAFTYEAGETYLADAELRQRLAAVRELLREALPNLAEYAILAADKPNSLWSRIHRELAVNGE